MFCTNVDVFADVATRLLDLRSPRTEQMQGPGKPLASAEAAEGKPTSPGPVGAFTGLDLPKALDEGSPGPDLQPMRPGLPNTPISACQELMLAIVAEAMVAGDTGYIDSPTFVAHLCYVGLDMHTAVKVQTEYLMGRVDTRRLNQHSMERPRGLLSPGP